MLLCVGLVCGCEWLSPPGVSGRWEGTAVLKMTPDSPKPYEIVLTLTEIDGAITGTFRLVMYYEVADLTGSLDGRHIEMTCRLLDTITFEGEVHGRTMAGTCTTHGATDTWEVTRVD